MAGSYGFTQRVHPPPRLDRLADTFADTGLVESARVARRLADVQPAVWHALARAIYILDGVGVESSDLTGIFDHALDQLGDGMSGQFFTPRSVARLIAELVGPITAGSRCLDPFSRAGELLVEVAMAGGGSPPLVMRVSHLRVDSCSDTGRDEPHAPWGGRRNSPPARSMSFARCPRSRARFEYVVTNPPFNMGDWCSDNPDHGAVALWSTACPQRELRLVAACGRPARAGRARSRHHGTQRRLLRERARAGDPRGHGRGRLRRRGDRATTPAFSPRRPSLSPSGC